MDFSLPALIGIGLAAMFFGYFFGLFEGRGQGYKKRQKEEAANPSLKAALQTPLPPPSAPAPVPAPPPAPVAPPPPDTSLLRLSLDAREQPCLDLDGQRVNTQQMAPQERKRLIDLMVLMRPWIDVSPVQSQERPATVTPAARPMMPPPPPPPPVMPVKPAEIASAPTTMVGQIDAILQTNLIGTPLATRGIRLVESAQGGAMVIVGLNKYPGVGDVPDPEVQAAIRTAIAEWEQKYTPG
jgi:hypothetical protein